MKFPPIQQIIPIHREVTNEAEYQTENLAKLDFVMNDKDLEAIQYDPSKPRYYEPIKRLTAKRR